MRKAGKSVLSWILLLMGALTFTACSDDNGGNDPDNENEFNTTTPDLSKIKVIESGQVSYHDHFAKMLKEAEEGNSEGDEAIADYARKMLHETDSIDQANAEAAGGNGANYSTLVYWYEVIQYPSVDNKGNEVMLSELISYPAHSDANNIIIGCHLTITSNQECPSNYVNNSWQTDVGMLTCHSRAVLGANHQCLVIIPDYQGYGVTSDMPHPYLCQNITARQVVDGVLAGKAYYEKTHKLEPDFQTAAVGYSQGGSVAMAVQKFIESAHLDGFDKLRFAGSVCGDGPYDPVTTLKTYIKSDKVYMPVASALFVKGMCDANPKMVKAGYKPADYFTQGFINTGIIDWLASKKYTAKEIQEKLVEYSGSHTDFTMMRKTNKDTYEPYTPETKNKYKWKDVDGNSNVYCTADQLITKETIDYIMEGKSSSSATKKKMATLLSALDMNNLCKLWTPRHPMIVFHSPEDEVVPFTNYESALNYFSGNIFKGRRFHYSFLWDTYHIGVGKEFYAIYEDGFVKDLFTGDVKDYERDHQ